MEYLVFGAVILAGVSALTGLATYLKKGTAITREQDTESFRLLKEYKEISLITGDLNAKVLARNAWKEKLDSHVEQVSIKQNQKKGGKVINLADYWQS